MLFGVFVYFCSPAKSRFFLKCSHVDNRKLIIVDTKLRMFSNISNTLEDISLNEKIDNKEYYIFQGVFVGITLCKKFKFAIKNEKI